MKDLTKIEEILLIAIWRLKAEAYGVKIRQNVSKLINKDFTYGNLYSALNQLTQKNYVVKHQGNTVPERKGRPRIVYEITPSGYEALRDTQEMNNLLWDGIEKIAFDQVCKQ
ncbi:MAG: PadR family transcriptional regulator [Bacteroidetes bacterium]|nr:PadR family transcriptional regulator [Bacteroidota bacterium]